MKHQVTRSLMHFILMLLCADGRSQEEGTILTLQQETMIEALAGETDDVVDDDSYLLQLSDFRRHPLSVNTADENELRELRILTDIQIHRLINYRLLFGKLLSIYELQAVPGWDLETIRKLRPFITIHEAENVIKNVRSRLS
ncbi:MAG TPA: helix-hairpin-helix domain-containing protein, partial [Flavitalea sp.]|nr:helix-hairpin-helix domain-containing protein [Flavitalea sp.]